VLLHTHFVVREDAQLLYGFASNEERLAFRQLLKISGVGPKLALSVLSGLSLGDLAAAVANKEVGRLTKIPGVGKKTAERLLLELQGKFTVTGGTPLHGGTATSANDDIVNALLALGYNEKEADWAAKQLPKEVGVSDGIRQALKSLSKS
jgi:Holliday junction DNA helicase RuvA